jgi:dTDP-4-dehydrorhamnose reductase
MQKLLVTGASGFLGWHVCRVAAIEWAVYGTYSTRAIDLIGSEAIDRPSPRFLKLDLTDFATLQQLFQTVQPDAVIHLAAQSNPNRCQLEPAASHRINVTAACNIAGLCADFNIPCAFSSTDLVFDGKQPPYRETDPVAPLSRYGEQKVLAEIGMLDRHPQTSICRMPLMFGAVPPIARSFIQPFIQTLRDGNELKLFVDEFRTPVSGTTAANGLLLALQRVQGQRIHLGGTERISRYEFGRLLAEVLELPIAHIQPCRQADVPMPAPRPVDVSLDSAFAFSLGYAPLSLRAELQALKGRV